MSYRRLADDVDEQLKNKLDRFLYEWAFSQVCQCRLAVLNPTSVSAMVDYFSWGGGQMSCCVAYLCQSSLRYVYATNSEASYTHVLSRPSDCREVRIAQIASCVVSRVRRTHYCVSASTHASTSSRFRGLDWTGPTHSRIAACCCDLLPCFTQSCRPSNIDTRDPQPVSVVAKSKVRNFTQARYDTIRDAILTCARKPT